MFREKLIRKWVRPCAVTNRKEESVVIITSGILVLAWLDKINHYWKMRLSKLNNIENIFDFLLQHLNCELMQMDNINLELFDFVQD